MEIEDDLGNAAEHSREPMTNKGRSGVGPCLALAGANAYYLWNAHWEHWSHMPPLEERTEYPYQNIRTKNYQWGDGDKVSHTIMPHATKGSLTANGAIDHFVSIDHPRTRPSERDIPRSLTRFVGTVGY